MPDKHYNIRVTIEEVTAARADVIERGVRVAGPLEKQTKELLSCRLVSGELNSGIDRIVETLNLHREVSG